MTRVDSHQHFWDPATGEYPWLTEERAAIRRRFGPEELQPNLDRHSLEGSVLVQARALLSESFDYLSIAQETATILGVVAWVDLTAASVADTLAELSDAPGGEYLVGIRHPVHDETDPQWLTRPEVLRGLEAVRDAGLAYDLLVRTRELPAALEASMELEDLQFVVDHAAKPPFGEMTIDSWSRWKDQMGDVAARENVACKVSGLVSETGGSSWPPPAFVPAVDHLFDSFGAKRMLFGSDWPVCLLDATYSEVVYIAEHLTSSLSGDERAAFFGGNATNVYQL